MICPKCQNAMQTVNRLGVHIERCQGCRGIFLDHGEIEQIASAEQNHYAPVAAAPPPHRADSPPPHRGGYRDSPPPFRGGYRDSPPPYGHSHGHTHGHQRRKRRSFLEELFD